MDIEQLHALFLKCKSANTDTRKTEENDLFFALKGAHFDGNTFAKKALEVGAKYAVIDAPQYAEDNRYIVVENVLETLQRLATFHRDYLKIPIVALTGSNGKTTTKELINSVLSKKYKTVATQGNLNNHIGVPLTLLSMNSETEMGVVEMGANHLKEIDLLANIAKPDYGCITNFGKAHLEGFGSTEGIIKGKSELYDYLKNNGKLIFVNGNDPIQLDRTTNCKRYIFGSTYTNSNVFIKPKACNPHVTVLYNGFEIKSHLIGAYNFGNISAAIAIGHYFNVESKQIKKAIESYIPSNNRSQIIQKESSKIILDAYNANPTSMEAALESIHRLSDKNKVLILGDMFELGNSAKVEHQNIVNLLTKLGFKKVILVGKNFSATTGGKTIERFETFDELKSHLKPNLFKDATILIKGSRGMALERLVDIL